ncbi:DUF4011 domain-containing protein [Methanobrevibacter sp. YE315]|uniref:DUF4011 domain-containing protein n=1 Tax=Methanobrevibacter sp. YE315 TaxID=1609968 RepID=UPI0008334E70|nr:DUF4011 domain-containing protein [Methanobrevibacter sp. YE315]
MENIKNFDFKDIELLRDNLLDMSLRNNLLNFKPRKKSIEIVDEDIVSLYNLIVLKETKMKFYSKENLESEPEPEPEYDKNNLDGYLKINPLNLNDNTWDPNAEIKESHLDKFLQTDYTKDELRKKLNYLYRENKTNLEEQGYNNLFLALGFLEWKEDDTSEAFRSAPIILVPMTIVKEKVSSPYTIYWTGDEVRSNLSLIYKLKDQNIDIEEFDELESEYDLINYLKSIEKAITPKKDWRITKDIFISNFSFKKFVMFKDLDSKNWHNIGNSCVNGLSGQNANSIDSEQDTEYDFDKINSTEIYNVLDADSSQLAVLEDIKNGKNLVVEGPPGTGKSQTIVNIIAELMALNKKILFVSEKKAALDVVKSRLDYLGLGEGCLELHGKNSNKKEVLKELQNTLELEHIQLKDKRNFQELDYLKRELNEYINTLHSIYGNTGLSAFTLIGYYIQNKEILEKNKQLLFDIHLTDVSSFDLETRGEYIKKLDEIKSYYDLVKPISENAWRDTYPYDISTMDIKEIELNLKELINTLNDFEENTKKIHDKTGINKFDSLDIESKINKLNILNSNSKLIKSEDNPNELINDIETFQEKTSNINLDVFNLDLENFNNEINELWEKIFVSNIDFNIIDNEDLEHLKDELDIKNQFIENSNLKETLNDSELEQKLEQLKIQKEFIENSNLQNTLTDSELDLKVEQLKSKKEFIENSNLKETLNDEQLTTKLNDFKSQKEFIENSNLKETLNDEQLTTKLNDFKSQKEFIENSNLKETLNDEQLTTKLNDFKSQKEFIENSNLKETLTDPELEQKLNDFKSKKEYINNSNLKETLNDEQLTTKLNNFKSQKEFIENSNLKETLTDPELEQKLNDFKSKKEYINNSNLKETLNDEQLTTKLNNFKSQKEFIENSNLKETLTDPELDLKLDQFKNKKDSFLKRTFNGDYKKIKKEFTSYYTVAVEDDKIINDLEKLIKTNNEYQTLKKEFNKYYPLEVSDDKIINDLEELIKTNVPYKKIKKEFNSYYAVAVEDDKIINDLEELIKTNNEYNIIYNEFNEYYSTEISSDKIIADLEELIETNNKFNTIKNEFNSYYAISAPDDQIINDLEKLIKTNEEYNLLKNKFSSYYDNEVQDDALINDLEELIKTNNEYNIIYNEFNEYYSTEISSDKIIADLEELIETNNKFNTIKNEFSSYYVIPVDDNQIINDLEELIETYIPYKKFKKEFNSFYPVAVTEDKIINDLEKLIKTNEEYNLLKNKFTPYYDYEVKDDELIDDLEKLIQIHQEFTILKNSFNKYYTNEISDQQLIDDLEKLIPTHNELEIIKNKILNYSKEPNLTVNEIIIDSNNLLSYFAQLNEICLEFKKYNIITTPKSIKEKMVELIELNKLLNKISDSDNVGSYYFNTGWDSYNSNTNYLIAILNNLNEFNEYYHDGFFNDTTVTLVETIDFDELNGLMSQLVKNKHQIISIYNKLNNKLYLNKELNCFDESTNDSNYNTITNISEYKTYMADFLSNIDDLNNYRLFVKYCEEYKDENTEGIINLIQKDNINSDLIINTFYYNFARTALRKVFSEDNILDDFNYALHQEKIEKFKQLDEEIMKSNIIRVKEKLSDNRPNILTLVSQNSSLGILKHEFTKKRRIMPIRKLLSRTFDAVSSIKPCFMMSPISIAQFLNPSTFESYFDYVIFDEASQVKIEDSIGAFLRAKKYVVMGDTKQLPPTSFFEKELDIDELDEDSYTTDIESILHLCKNTTETKMLKWHYRSRHESLINVSNNEFYDNKLYVFPSPMIYDEDLGLKFEYDPTTEYQRGYGANNIKEAENLIEYLFGLVRKYGNSRSIGVATFNIKQRNTILDILENKLKDHPELEQYFDESGKEGFFVKNLENIQGDERDIILISMGYGKDSNGKLTMNFGPLNKDGGERRLNVLITRARMQCIVFSNFKSSEMVTNEKTPRGVEALKTFLYYAELGELPENYHTGEDFDSPFEESVYDFLTDEGYQVEKQVGCAGYKIDLAIVDKEDSNRYILAIECDGATYHSSKSARDRDRLRQSVLEDLGWKFYRIWSTDWFHQTKSAKQRLLDAVEYAIKQKDNEDAARTVESNFEPEIIIKTNEDLINEQFDDYFEDYKYCTDFNKYGRSYEAVLKALVECECPIHIDDIYDTVKKIGNQRADKRFKRNIKFCLARVDTIYSYNDFYYDTSFNVKTMKVRKRIKPNINRISEEELAKAIINTLKTEFSSSRSNLIKSASTHLGFKSAGSKIKERFNYIIDYMLAENIIKEKNGIIELV